MQAELGLLQQAVEIHGLVLAFHRSRGGLVRAAIWGWQGQKAAGSGRGDQRPLCLVGRVTEAQQGTAHCPATAQPGWTQR